ncbi:MAG: alanine--tRNA ligase, partial [Veillonella caviae]|nr:alanine--tRNA ligase [Veillonella caviae]
ILGPGIKSIADNKDFVKRVVLNEEERFNQTLEQGLELLNSLIDTLETDKVNVVPGTEVFKLYDTYGFPWELTEEIAHERGFTIDHDGFDAAMKEQRERAREARVKEDAKVATPDITFLKDEVLEEDESATTSAILVIGKGADRVDTAADGDEVTIIVRHTPFHAEGGGQLGDTGFIVGPMGKVEVHNTKRLPEGTIYHIGTVVEGSISDGDNVTFEVDVTRRHAMARNHTATHLLHAALKRVLGDHVNQAGSLVTPDYLRFDFTHFSPVTQEELNDIEELVNEEILKATDLAIAEMSMDEAKAKGAMALFGDKYGDVVRVVEVPGFSVELCGGSHVGNTAFISTFRLTSESGIGSGVRRIEAITGRAAMEAAKGDRETLERLAGELKTKPAQVEERLAQVLADAKEVEKQLTDIQKNLAAAGAADAVSAKVTVNGIDAVMSTVKVSSMDELRDYADKIIDVLGGSGVVLVGSVTGEDKVSFVCKASKDVVAKGVHAGNIVKAAAQVAGGNGGGRPDMAQAGGKEPEKLLEALKAGDTAFRAMVGAE